MNAPEPKPVTATAPPVKPDAPAAESPAAPGALTPEEQMARFEEDLKFNDWGHQPC